MRGTWTDTPLTEEEAREMLKTPPGGESIPDIIADYERRSGGNSMPPRYYNVTDVQPAMDGFRAAAIRAMDEGWLPKLLAAAKYVWDELAYDPRQFGEARDRRDAMKLDRRIVFVGPLVVEFAVTSRRNRSSFVVSS